MIELRFNLTDFEAKAKALGGAQDQVQFALSLALNNAVRNARNVLVQDTWPQHVTQRNPAFIGRALRTKFATKSDLHVEIYDDLQRGSLKLHAEGGTKVARKRLAIPVSGSAPRASRGAHGVRKSLRPGAIIASTPKRALRITAKGIFVGKSGRLNLMYAFKPSAVQPADVPFEAAFRQAIKDDVRTSFPAAMARAMSTRR